MNNQLNIFSWNTDKLAEAWQQLAVFDFVSCEMILNELLEQDATDESAKTLAEEKNKWQLVFAELANKEGEEGVRFLLAEVMNGIFEREWGPMLLKDALYKEIIKRAEKQMMFHITETLTLADLYTRQHSYEAAEKILQRFVDENKNNTQQLCKLADVQFEQSKFSEANHHYMLALFVNPTEVAAIKIKNKKIAEIISNHGPDMAAAWIWLYGENVPLNLSLEFMYSADNRQKKTATACYLLMMAEKARRENNAEQKVEFRKKLHDSEPLLYQAYFNFCNTGKFLSVDAF